MSSPQANTKKRKHDEDEEQPLLKMKRMVSELYDKTEKMLDNEDKDESTDAFDRGYEQGYSDATCQILTQIGSMLVKMNEMK